MVCAGVHEIDMDLLRFAWSRSAFIRENNVPVSNRFNGTSSKQLHTIIAVGDDVVGYRIQGLAPFLDPVESVVYGTKFPGVTRGSPGTKPLGTGRGREHWAPYRSGVRSAREDDVDPPACGTGVEG